MSDNPFGKWTTHRATIAALSRTDARDENAEAEARQLLKASRLADAILRERDSLTAAQRATLARLIRKPEPIDFVFRGLEGVPPYREQRWKREADDAR